MRLLKALLISLLIFTSCGESRIPKQKMSKIIAEIYISDRYINTNQELVRAVDSSFLYEPIFNKYGYTTKDFIYTINYYVEQPAKLRAIYLGAKQILQDEMGRADAEYKQERSRDSLIAVMERTIMPGVNDEAPDSRTRALRWIYLPARMPKWTDPLTDTSLVKFDAPLSPVWWKNNIQTNQKPFLDYEKNSSPVSLPDKLQTDSTGIRMLK